MPLSRYIETSNLARRCPACETEQPLSNYTIRKNGRVVAYCKPCNAKRTAAYRANNRNRYLSGKRESRRRWKAEKSTIAIKANWDNLNEEQRQNIGCGVYCITIGNKFYIGSCTHFESRMNEHARKLRTDRHINKAMQEEFKQHGWIGAELIESCDPDVLHIRESEYLAQWVGHEDCLNIIGEAGNKPRLPEDVVEEIRNRHAGGESQASISRSLGVAPFIVFNVVHRAGRYKESSVCR